MGAIRSQLLGSSLSDEQALEEGVLSSLEYRYSSYCFDAKQVLGESRYKVSIIASTYGGHKSKKPIAESFGKTLAEARDEMVNKMNKLLGKLQEGSPRTTHYIQK